MSGTQLHNKIIPDDLRAIAKMLNVLLNDERFIIMAPIMDKTFTILNELLKQTIACSVEPNTYLAQLQNLKEAPDAESI